MRESEDSLAVTHNKATRNLLNGPRWAQPGQHTAEYGLNYTNPTPKRKAYDTADSESLDHAELAYARSDVLTTPAVADQTVRATWLVTSLQDIARHQAKGSIPMVGLRHIGPCLLGLVLLSVIHE